MYSCACKCRAVVCNFRITFNRHRSTAGQLKSTAASSARILNGTVVIIYLCVFYCETAVFYIQTAARIIECNIVHDTGIVIHCNICIYCVNSPAVRGCIIAVFINKICCCFRCIFISDNSSSIQRKRATVNVNTASVTVCFIKAYRTVCKFCASVCNVNSASKTCPIKTDYSTV